ncbi:hypothetical protein NQ317_016111 [Molorchus minor]|uniref:Uncharacterized protein n=1 Tax=Molorchus minor TaxID=1323400 RepID=A0ABQ9IU10_9CUCU|nr:hypothetical protein NQ317_016111 [Molorchus minor]
MSSRIKKIMTLVSENSFNGEISMSDSDSKKSLTLSQSSISPNGPGYVEVDSHIINLMSYQKTPTSAQENASRRRHNQNLDIDYIFL